MKVLIVDDDKILSEVIRKSLVEKSYVVDMANNGGDGSFMGKSYEYDAILLDYSLPKKNGLTICKEIRAAGKNTPIIFLSVNDDTDLKVSALNSGADDYLVKPFSFEELQARLGALHRRPAITKQRIYTVSNLILNIETHSVTRGDQKIDLTRKEFGVLEYLMRHQGVLVSRVLIMEHVWTADKDLLSNTIETHIRNIRNKLNVNNMPNLIRNVPGHGYIMSA